MVLGEMGQHVIWMCVMEENPMATEPSGLSLALVLLRNQFPGTSVQVPDRRNIQERHRRMFPRPRRINTWNGERRGIQRRGEEEAKNKLMQVQVSLYKTLYQIIEDYGETHNNALNMAIGKALALVIEDD